MINLFGSKKRTGCPGCYDKDIISFGGDYLESEFQSTIAPYEKIAGVTLYRCEKCEMSFFMRGKMYDRIFDGQVGLLRKWGEKEIGISNHLKEIIDFIGISKNWGDKDILPCKIELYSGEEFDFTTILFSDEPPLGDYYAGFANIFFIDEIKLIRQSMYSLSQEIRLACLVAEEVRMGYYPTIVQTKENVEAVINGISLFFKADNLNGSDFKLANKKWSYKGKYIYDLNREPESLVIVKTSKS